MKKWEQDLIRDIKTYTDLDDVDWISALPEILFLENYASDELWEGQLLTPNIAKIDPIKLSKGIEIEITDCNLNALRDKFLEKKDNCNSILEIGVGRNGPRSFCHVFFENKNVDTKYVGIDVEDRSWIAKPEDNIFFLQADSSDYDNNIKIINEKFNVNSFDFIFIDGLHSVNQVLLDWEYTRNLSDGGIVGFHDTTKHPGPYLFIKSLNRKLWEVNENMCQDDFGIGFAKKL